MNHTDQKIAKIEYSTRTIWPVFTRLHDHLRMKNTRYYTWHLHPLHKFVHMFVLIVFGLLILSLITLSLPI